MKPARNTPLNWKPARRPAAVTLRGRTVALEPLEARRHAGDLFEAVEGHDGVWEWLGDGPYTTAASLYQAVETKEMAAEAIFLAIVPAETGKAAGYASWMRMDPANGVVEVGNILLTPALQRTTAATEAMYLMARHVFEDLGYRRYEWKCNVLNEPSRRAAERLGFQFEGIFRQHMVIKGQNRDTAWYSMLDGEWPARKRAFEGWLDAANFDESGRQRKSLRAF
jgi:RimJ/RimL family protein N-acetyltransferase